MSDQSVFESLRSYLSLSSRVVSIDGVPFSSRPEARRGDEIVISFRLRNLAPRERIQSGRPLIRFRDPHILINPFAPHATFTDGSTVQRVEYFPDTLLMGQETTQVSASFTAVGELGDIADEFSLERIVDTWVVATVDPFFFYWPVLK